jgi:hypothetical protein
VILDQEISMNIIHHISKPFLIIALLAVLVSACSLPASTQTSIAPTQETPDLMYTSAVKTVLAQLTSAAATPWSGLATETGTALAQAPSTEVSATQTVITPTAALTPNPTAEPSPSATAPEVTPSIVPSPTTASTDPKLSLGDPTFQDKFADTTNWALASNNHIDMSIKDGKLVMKAFNPDQWEGWSITRPKTTNFYIELTATPQTCSGLDHYGLVLRTKSDGSVGYLFGFSCDGRYSFSKWDGDKYTIYIDWTENSAIQKGPKVTNRLGVEAQGDHFTLYANGVKIDDLDDSSYDKGNFGVIIGAAETANFVVEADEIDYWKLP